MTETSNSLTTQASPAKALQEIVTKKISGRLIIGNPRDGNLCWQLYTGEGKIHFAHSNLGQQERLFYLLHQHYPQLDLSATSWDNSQTDYQYITQCWRSGSLTIHQVREILHLLTQEAVVQILNIPQAELNFQKTIGLDPILLSASFKELIQSVNSQISAWIKIRSDISSPLQRLTVVQPEQLSQSLPIQIQNKKILELLPEILSQNWTLYKAAQQMEIDVLELAQTLQPLIQQKILSLNEFNYTPQQPGKIIVACVDDSSTVQRQVKLSLEVIGYEVLSITEPNRALTMMARQKPQLIFMDINMPETDGYELCRMLRQSTLLQDVPIVMLTGRDGFVDRMKARLVGATDYMTKPIKTQDLIEIAQKLIDRPDRQDNQNSQVDS